MNKKTIISIIAILVVLLLLPMVITSPYHMHLIITTCINVMLGFSFSLLYSAGMLSIAGGAFWGIGAYASALLVTKLGFSFWTALPFSALAALLVALVLGTVITKTSGLAFMIQTLVLAMIIPEIFGNLELFGGWAGLLNPVQIPGPLRFGEILYYAYFASSECPCFPGALLLQGGKGMESNQAQSEFGGYARRQHLSLPNGCVHDLFGVSRSRRKSLRPLFSIAGTGDVWSL
jgi:hypothetical protein